MTPSAGTKLGPYEILGPLGAGGMGEVYRARDTRVDRAVALKVLPEEFFEEEDRRARFEREARTLASLNHPGIAVLYSFEEIPGSPSSSSSSSSSPAAPSATRHLLVMELVEGEDLARRIASGPLPLEESLPLARQIAEALEAAHEKGIVHRDLKPANVKVTPDGRVKLLDFGLAKIFESEPSGSPSISYSPTLTARATAAGIVLGTAAYMSPEQARGKPVDKRTDVWAFGCVLYEMLAGKRAFEGETVSDTLAAILKEEPNWAALPPQTPTKIRDLLRRCLRREAKQRLHDIADARLELEELLNEASLASGSGARSGRPFTFGEKIPAPGPTVASAERAKRVRGSKTALYLPWALAAALAAATGGLALRARAPSSARILRSAIVLPSGFALDSENTSLALSPDGRSLALAGSGADGKRRLFVRALDSAAVQPLEGTDDATYPFWSPDGRSLGFFADRKLKRITISGGTPQTICDAQDGRGGSWGSEGVIVFSPHPYGGLFSVAATGGTPSALTTAPTKESSHRNPHFLPDGRRALFFSGTSIAAKTNGIFVVDVASKKIGLVAPESSEGLYVDPGYLVFVRGVNLMAQRIDPGSLKLGGDAVPIAEGVWFNPNRWTGSFTVSSSGLLVYQSGSLARRSQLTRYDLEGRETGQVASPSFFRHLAISPRGDVAVAEITEPNERSSLWMYDLSRGVASRFTFGDDESAGFSSQSVWSADGRTVYFSNADGTLLAKDARGLSNTRTLLGGGVANQYACSAAPDGSALAVQSQQSATGWDLGIVPLNGEAKLKPFLTTPANERDSRFSPDGKWLAYISDESGRNELYLVPYPGPGGKWQISPAGAEEGFWLSATELGFWRDRKLFAVTLRFDGGALTLDPPRPLLGGKPVLANTYAVYPDGKRLLCAIPAGDTTSPPLTLVTDWAAAVSR
jgi:serine/threonine protein kinase